MEGRHLFLPRSDILKARGIVNALHNYWWVVDPERGLLFVTFSKSDKIIDAHSQCNPSRTMAERFRDRMYPELEVEQIDLVLVPYKIESL